MKIEYIKKGIKICGYGAFLSSIGTLYYLLFTIGKGGQELDIVALILGTVITSAFVILFFVLKTLLLT